MGNATYRCVRCGARWQHEPGPTECPYCGSLYAEWLNYLEMFG